MNFGCIHIAWKHREATNHAVKQFRKYHPNNPYTLISDRGFDYSELANKYNLNYAPHFGMFKNIAGNDLIDQLKFMHDQGFMAIEDNGMK